LIYDVTSVAMMGKTGVSISSFSTGDILQTLPN